MVRVMSVYCLPDWEYHLYSERWLHMKNKNLAAVLYALLAALFYAVNVPCSKLLLGIYGGMFIYGSGCWRRCDVFFGQAS